MCPLISEETLESSSSRFGRPHGSENAEHKKKKPSQVGDTRVNFEEDELASTKRSFAYSFRDFCRSGCHLRA